VLEHAPQVRFAGLTTHFALFLPLFRRGLATNMLKTSQSRIMRTFLSLRAPCRASLSAW